MAHVVQSIEVKRVSLVGTRRHVHVGFHNLPRTSSRTLLGDLRNGAPCQLLLVVAGKLCEGNEDGGK